MAKAKFISAELLQRARDYVRDEPGFTAPFMAWEMGIPLEKAKALTARLYKDGYVYMVEPASRPHPAVYAYKVPRHVLGADAAPRLYQDDEEPLVADLAAKQGVIVPHTRIRGQSDTPGRTRKRQRRGERIREMGKDAP